MAPHLTGSGSSGKRQFLFRVEADKAVLDAAAYANANKLWVGNKAKVFVENGPVGVIGRNGQLTNWLSITRPKPASSMGGRRVVDVMGTDIMNQLVDATRLRAAWSPDHARSLAASFARATPDAWVDWDEESGEEWARVLVDQFVVALIRAKIPLVIVVRGELAQLRQLEHDAVMIVVDDMDSPWLSATSESIGRAFPEREVSPTLDPTAFSAMDLWFATT